MEQVRIQNPSINFSFGYIATSIRLCSTTAWGHRKCLTIWRKWVTFGYSSSPNSISPNSFLLSQPKFIDGWIHSSIKHHTSSSALGGKMCELLFSLKNIYQENRLLDQLIFGFGRLGLNTKYRTPETTKKAGIVDMSNTRCISLSLVQWIGWRTAIVAFTCSKNLQENARTNKPT